MAELAALISWLTVFYFFALEWDEERDGGELSVQLEPVVQLAQKAWDRAVYLFERGKEASARRSSGKSAAGDSTLDRRNTD